MMPLGHGEGGDASKCPFAAMMKAMKDNPKMAERLSKEAEEFDSDTDEEEEEEDEEKEAGELDSAYEGEGGGGEEAEQLDPEVKARRERMMAAMMEQFSNGTAGEFNPAWRSLSSPSLSPPLPLPSPPLSLPCPSPSPSVCVVSRPLLLHECASYAGFSSWPFSPLLPLPSPPYPQPLP